MNTTNAKQQTSKVDAKIEALRKQSDWTKEDVKILLGCCKDWAEKAIVTLYNLQTSDEQRVQQTTQKNGVGFNGTDSYILSSFAQQIIGKGRKMGDNLSFKQHDICYKLLPKYAGQILEAIAAKRATKSAPQSAKRDDVVETLIAEALDVPSVDSAPAPVVANVVPQQSAPTSERKTYKVQCVRCGKWVDVRYLTDKIAGWGLICPVCKSEIVYEEEQRKLQARIRPASSEWWYAFNRECDARGESGAWAERKSDGSVIWHNDTTPADFDETYMQMCEAEGDRAQTIRDERAKHEWKMSVERW